MKDTTAMALLLQYEEQIRRLNDRLAELEQFKMAGRAKNLVWLIKTEVRELDVIAKWHREACSTAA